MKIFTDPGHVILLAVAVVLALAIYLVRRRRQNVDHHLDGDDHPHGAGHDHPHGAGHGHPHGAGHGPADPERHHR